MPTNPMFPSIAGSALSGAAAGTAIAPGIGTAIGAGIGAISGFFSGKEAKKLDKAYQAAEGAIPMTDSNQAAFLDRVRQQERNMRAGTDASSVYAMQNVRNAGIQSQNNFLRAGGQGQIGNMLRSQQLTNQGIAGVAANASAGANQMLQFQGSLIDNIANRVYNRQRELRNQAMERSVSQRQNIQNTLQGSLAMIPGITAGFSKSGSPNEWGFDPGAYKAPQKSSFDVPTEPAYRMNPIGSSPIPSASDRIPMGFGQPSFMQPRFPQASPLMPGTLNQY